MQVLPGSKVPTDGVVVHGSSYTNESMVTGESRPVWKTEGAAVIGSTINTSATLLITATRVGSETTLAQIMRLVERAQLAKAPIQAFADRVAALFVPIVIGLAFLTWLIWYSSGNAGSSSSAIIILMPVHAASTPLVIISGSSRRV